ncbi:MAG: zinc ribbon domain-containing protein [Erysipelotrichaceae bacterium]|nr:zinc ribbon domain-containing protein [Erysipelotrichaceae bacterium]MDY5251675.1 hypothetical protein [Erysipelotrichaceae bacterium]
MKSIKPGRGPSMMNGVASIFAVLFGIFWTIMAINIGAPSLFPVFGLIFIALGVMQAIYSFKNATSKNRFSAFDITNENEEIDPLNAKFSSSTPITTNTNRFCPYCGKAVDNTFEYCPSCGKKLPN